MSLQMGCGCGKNCGGGCSSPTSISGCGNFPRNCDSVQNRAVPYFVQAQPIEQSHCQEIRTEKFSSAICSQISWIIPNCNSTATLILTDILYVPTGAYIWNSVFGYFLVQSFDKTTGELVVENLCTQQNAAGGTEVPACTCFIVTSTPCPSSLGNIVYLAADFIAPNNGDCVTIDVTSTEDLVDNSQIGISTGTYLLDTIINATQISICNEGSGIAGGTLVVALNIDGEFQYPITTIIGNISSQVIGTPTSGTINSGNLTNTVSVTIPLTNPSAVDLMTIFYSVEGWVNGTIANGHAGIFSIAYNLTETKDSGTPTVIVDQATSEYTGSDAANSYSQNIIYTGIYQVAPGDSITIQEQFIITYTGSGSSSYTITDQHIQITAIGVIG